MINKRELTAGKTLDEGKKKRNLGLLTFIDLIDRSQSKSKSE